jgi:PIN domain nuclease of toxin-antitoxin system
MRLLLDTHTFIWWASEPGKLSPTALGLCEDANSTLYLSVGSVWEMQIKHQLGKLELREPLDEIIQTQQTANHLQLLPIEVNHILELYRLPYHHRDPFDRLLITQAKVEGLSLLSGDSVFSQYAVRVIW